jgi:LacI family repressor for deo operon, udp, cdd, tsx, nupC, and nupG
MYFLYNISNSGEYSVPEDNFMTKYEHIKKLDLSGPYRSRLAAQELYDRVVTFLCEEKPGVGTPFLTDAELVTRTGLSRSTVRRAMDDLQREGWIDRRIGLGTFTGTRTGALINSKTGDVTGIRLGVLVYSLGNLSNDWYTPLILEGIDMAASELNISIELLGTCDRDIDAISLRLEQSIPTVLVCLSNGPREAFVIRDAQRLGIPCIVSGTPHMRLGVPCVMEDNAQAMEAAVDYLHDKGHRRIALSIQRNTEPWVFARHEAFFNALSKHKIAPCSMGVHWLPLGCDSVLPDDAEDSFMDFLEAHKPTAIIAGSRLSMICLDALHRKKKLLVPKDLSVMSFEQDERPHGQWFDGLVPDKVVLPLNEIGKKVADLAVRMAAGNQIPASTMLPSTIMPGETVVALKVC